MKRLFVRLVTKLLGGYIKIGRLTVYGFNAMHIAINWRGKQNCWCFHPPVRWFGRKWPWYFYVSPNATPWAALYAVGPGVDESEKTRAHQRMRLVASTRLLYEEEIADVTQFCERLGNEKLECSEAGPVGDEVDEILRITGRDPDKVAAGMQAFVGHAFEEAARG